jgi:thioredoxin reductase (NADPH)
MIYDCIVIGAGPAGIAAAVQMKRAGLNIVLFEKKEVGGLLKNANLIENYLGFPNGVSGKELVEHFRNHIKKQEISLIKEEVIAVKRKKCFLVQTEKRECRSHHVIIATGTVPKEANIAGEKSLRGKRLFYEINDLPRIKKKKTIVIIGGGDVGFDYALQLSQKGHKPIIITKGKAKCLPPLKERAKKRRIQCIEHCHPKRLGQSGHRIDILCPSRFHDSDYVLIAVGRQPSYPRIMTKNRKNLYFVGDVRNKRYRQVHIATGDALRAAMSIIHSTSHHS